MTPLLTVPAPVATIGAAALLVVVATAVWWAWPAMRGGRHKGFAASAADCVVAGVIAAIAMIPVGLVVTAAGFELNRYGRAVAEALVGTDGRLVLLAMHLVIGVISAIPPVWAASTGRWPPNLLPGLIAGAGYGAGYWLVVNAVTLPALFGQRHPWERGPAAVWPSLLVHVIFGLGVAAVLHARRRSAAPVGGVK
jgi:hypothetical protein